jgi:CheY-like chemotaxis protein
MPIVDGLTSTKMIRSYEKSHPDCRLSPRATANGRVPIFAVSASLVERERQTYINAGFDGWILKPIDFKRLNVLLLGIVEDDTRKSCLYHPGGWEKGGWFHRGQSSILRAATLPSNKSPVQLVPEKEIVQPDKDSLHSSESGSITPKSEPRKAFIHDERLSKPDKPEEAEAAEAKVAAEPQVNVQALQDQSEEESVPIKDRPVEDVTDKPQA